MQKNSLLTSQLPDLLSFSLTLTYETWLNSCFLTTLIPSNISYLFFFPKTSSNGLLLLATKWSLVHWRIKMDSLKTKQNNTQKKCLGQSKVENVATIWRISVVCLCQRLVTPSQGPLFLNNSPVGGINMPDYKPHLPASFAHKSSQVTQL